MNSTNKTKVFNSQLVDREHEDLGASNTQNSEEVFEENDEKAERLGDI